jgi:hypothetical protein
MPGQRLSAGEMSPWTLYRFRSRWGLPNGGLGSPKYQDACFVARDRTARLSTSESASGPGAIIILEPFDGVGELKVLIMSTE